MREMLIEDLIRMLPFFAGFFAGMLWRDMLMHPASAPKPKATEEQIRHLYEKAERYVGQARYGKASECYVQIDKLKSVIGKTTPTAPKGHVPCQTS